MIPVTHGRRTPCFLCCLLFRWSDAAVALDPETTTLPPDLLLQLSKVLVVRRTELLIMRFGVIRWILSRMGHYLSRANKRISGLETRPAKRWGSCSTRREQQLLQQETPREPEPETVSKPGREAPFERVAKPND